MPNAARQPGQRANAPTPTRPRPTRHANRNAPTRPRQRGTPTRPRPTRYANWANAARQRGTPTGLRPTRQTNLAALTRHARTVDQSAQFVSLNAFDVNLCDPAIRGAIAEAALLCGRKRNRPDPTRTGLTVTLRSRADASLLKIISNQCP